eukprot:gene12927-biopygen2759
MEGLWKIVRVSRVLSIRGSVELGVRKQHRPVLFVAWRHILLVQGAPMERSPPGAAKEIELAPGTWNQAPGVPAELPPGFFLAASTHCDAGMLHGVVGIEY